MKHQLILALLLFVSCQSERPQTSSTIALPSVNEEELIENLYIHYYSNPQSQAERDQNEIIEYAIAENLNLVKSQSGLFYLFRQDKEGEPARWGSKVSVHYSGSFLNGHEFNSSYKKGKPLKTYIGEGIDGFNEALLLMSVGDKIIAIIPSQLAYGVNGYLEIIPPNSILLFEMELISVS